MTAPSFVCAGQHITAGASTKPSSTSLCSSSASPFHSRQPFQVSSRDTSEHPRRTKRARITASTQVPTHFNSSWYQETITPVEIEIAAHHIRGSTSFPQTDFHFVDRDRGLMAVIDYPCPSPSDCTHRPTIHHCGDEPPGEAMINYIRKMLVGNTPMYSEMPMLDLSRILTSAMDAFDTPAAFSGLIIDVSTNVMRIASVGAAGLLLIRDDGVFYRSYPSNASALIDHLSPPALMNPTERLKSDTTHVHVLAENVHADFLELEENDLVLAGTDGVFANLTELQMLAFVRPVPDRMDKTLAIANNTCLGSWTSDDVDFISYYLASLAANFATATNSPSQLHYPFPASPHLDDVTVLCASCSFSM